ncbi:MAG TPA: bifunctional phosphoribosyl-AMP cyclohydrolase/phosphoribosyl-ATP diphosphatase HisIE [Holophagaceae bacterium]|nr:bifunctional phosphoribosyl-AMP cyclohydrolase/phosphoribosyl-ATP diphosphatase HisIE [Holophagaceae bacterium]
MLTPDDLRFDAQGLIPGIVQAPSGEVRMLGWLNADSLRLTQESGYVTFWSRSRRSLWMKGESSGNRLRLVSIAVDCDGDTLLITAEPEGPTCHRGTATCFGEGRSEGIPFLGELERILHSRREEAKLDGSYTQKLFAQGLDRIAKKVVEEAGEVVLAAKNLTPESEVAREEFLGEAADLLFHLQMLLLDRGCSLADVTAVLARRHADRTSAPSA